MCDGPNLIIIRIYRILEHKFKFKQVDNKRFKSIDIDIELGVDRFSLFIIVITQIRIINSKF